MRILSFDIGGTNIRAASADVGGQTGPVGRLGTPASDHGAFFNCLIDRIAQEPNPPEAIAISIAGVVNPRNGTMIAANIPAIHGTNFAEDLQQQVELPVYVSNDADCFAVAEANLGAGRGHDIVFGIILGTGVGGGLAVHGGLINRNGGYAGEWGHGPVSTRIAGDPPVALPSIPCGCGLSGCLDTVAGGRGLERLHEHLHQEVRQASDIINGWRSKERSACRTMEIYLDVISGPLAMAVNLTGATVVPAGGGLASAHDLLVEIDRAVRPLTLANPDHPLVVPAASGPEPGLSGAALIAAQAMAQASC